MLPRGSDSTRVPVTKWAQENYSNPMGYANFNPILDSRQYVVEFEYSTEAYFTAKAITKSMNYRCNPDINMYLMHDSIVYVF